MTALIDYLIEQIEQGAPGDKALNLQSLVGALGERATLIHASKRIYGWSRSLEFG